MFETNVEDFVIKRIVLSLNKVDKNRFNISYGATVGAWAANTCSNLINFYPCLVLNKSYDFSKWFIDYLKMLRNLNCLFVVVDI